MSIEIYKEVVEIFDDKIYDATKYNGGIYKLTEFEEDNHGDMIKYLEENKLTTEQLQDIVLSLVQALRGHI